jgi:polyphosphate kinase
VRGGRTVKGMISGMKNCYKNRELSWLEFNSRVLEEAADKTNPLCERLNFASIFQSNLDEFFMVRVGSLHDQMLTSGNERENKTNMTSEEQLDAIMLETARLNKKRDEVYGEIMTELAAEGVELINFAALSAADAQILREYFINEIQPLISPQVVGKRQPFPFLQSDKIYAIVSLDSKGTSEKIGIVPCSGVFERLIPAPSDKRRFMLVEELILHFAADIFDKYKVKGKTLIKIIRNADIDADSAVYDQYADYRDEMEKIIKRRRKLCPVKAELSREIGQSVIKLLCAQLELNENQVFSSKTPLDLSFVGTLSDILRDRSKLFYPPRVPQLSPMVDDSVSMIEQIKKRDILLSYPYESIRPFLRLLNEAAYDPNVVSIKMTLYRVAKYSRVVQALINAAENGKEVVVLVELKARFDEENNIEWSRRLEDAGCRIIYGIDKLKVHSKLCLITRKEGSRIEYITQIGTGNYNEKTARLYTDYSLMTSSVQIGVEAGHVFNELAMGEVVESTKHLLVAPKCLQNKILAMMDEEIEIAKAGGTAYIGAKINSLTDKVIIKKLIEASRAGVRVDLVVRGICCLIPGIEGYTENIKVISIVGRYLEHSRVYIFGTPERSRIYISSADYMTRNTLKRVEVAAPVYDENIKARIWEMFAVMLHDNVKARIMLPDGKYVRRKDENKPLNAQEYFYEQAYNPDVPHS